MNTRFLAHALADAMRPRVIKAARYLLEHEALEQLGMPIEIARHALDRKPLETEPVKAMREWNEKGLYGMHQAKDNGKTHAAALWCIARLRAGKRTVWISCPGILGWADLDSILAKTQRSDAVVLDDVGPGLAGTAGFQNKLTAWIQERGQRPTVLTSNAHRGELETYLGERLLSRLEVSGDLVAFPKEKGLRKPDTEELTKCGHGKEWAKARWLTKTIGYEPVDSFDVETNRVVHGHRVGDGIEGASYEALQALALRCGLSLDDLGDRAEEIEQAEAELAAGLLKSAEKMATGAASREKSMDSIKRLAAGDIARAKAPPIGSPLAPELRKHPEWATRESLRALGFEVTRKRLGTRELAACYRVLYRGSVIGAGLRSEPAGWDIAAGVLDSFTLPPGSCSSPDYYQRTEAIRDAAMARRRAAT